MGLPLATRLIKDGYKVKGSTTSDSKLKNLKKLEIIPFLLCLENGEVKGKIEEFLEDVELLIINIPPQLRKNSKVDYINNLKSIIPYLERSNIKRVIFISSTSVYKDTVSFDLVSEEKECLSSSEKSRTLVKAENLFFGNQKFKTNVIRFAGLIGADRHPAKYLSGKSNLQNPMAPVNLIHLNDCIALIRSMIDQNTWNEIFNASYPIHPSRKEYYSKVCQSLNLTLPQFDDEGLNKGKIVSSEKVQQNLDFSFRHNIY